MYNLDCVDSTPRSHSLCQVYSFCSRMDACRQRIPRRDIGNADCILRAISMLDDPVDVVRACAVSHIWRRFVIQQSLCKRLFTERFPGVTNVAYKVHGRYHIIRLSDVLAGDAEEWGALEREHRIYSHLLQPLSKRMDCPRDCILFPIGASSIAENILTANTPVCTYPVGFSFLSTEEKSETRVNFLQCVEKDVCISILSFLDDPADFVRLSAVSRFWRQFVIANGLAKDLCLKALPELSTIAGVFIGSSGTSSSAEAQTSTSMTSEFFERDHTVYASLLHAVKRSKIFRKNCIEYAISASSTNNFPSESISNTMHPRDICNNQPSYWSSKGQRNPQVPETLIYKLKPGVWLVTEIDIKPFKAYFQVGMPTYSARSVRFRMGHPKSKNEISSDPESFPLPNGVDNKFVWTYTSPEFHMGQGTLLLPFKLPEPTLCLGGYVQFEFLGRVQRQQSDRLFYIRMNHVRVVGRPLFPAFDTEIEEASGEMLLKYCPESLGSIMKSPSGRDVEEEMTMVRMIFLEDILPYMQQDPRRPHLHLFPVRRQT